MNVADYVVPANLNPFWHYQAAFDAATVVKRYATHPGTLEGGYYVNFLGVKIDPQLVPPHLAAIPSQVEGLPWPNNWHADIAEFAAALHAVDLSGANFTVVELGCGWGCWLNMTGAAARSTGRSIKLIGVEADHTHVGWANQSLTLNGFNGHFEIIHGIAGANKGKALFPRQGASAGSWALEAIFDAGPTQIARARIAGSHDVLNVVTFGEIAARHGAIDLLHIDIQGAEADLIESCLPALRAHVRFIVIGTHSRQIEGRLEKALLSDGWVLEMDRPAIVSLEDGRQTLRVDGVQGWRNPHALAG